MRGEVKARTETDKQCRPGRTTEAGSNGGNTNTPMRFRGPTIWGHLQEKEGGKTERLERSSLSVGCHATCIVWRPHNLDYLKYLRDGGLCIAAHRHMHMICLQTAYHSVTAYLECPRWREIPSVSTSPDYITRKSKALTIPAWTNS